MTSRHDLKPDFGFEQPAGYHRMLASGEIDFRDSPLDPWYFIERDHFPEIDDLFQKTWSRRTRTMPGRIVPFARRGDCDDVACLLARPDGIEVLLVHGWTTDGYDVVAKYTTFEDWAEAARGDVAELKKLR
jgi:hypothetical protein